MKTIAGTLAALGLVGILTGCRPDIKEGEVYEKTYQPPRSWMQIMPVLAGKVVVCIPIMHHEPEHYILRIRIIDTKANDIRTRNFNVNKNVYDRFNTGEWYNSACNCNIRSSEQK